MTAYTTACPDWQDRILARQSIIPLPPLFPDEAEAAMKVFKSLRMPDVAGQPTFGEACEEWVFDLVRAIFGAYDHETATRLVDEYFLLIAKKNGKSTIAAGIMVTALTRNWRHYADLLILAPTIEIAKNSFEPAAAMVRLDEQLSKLLKVQDHIRQISHRTTHAVLKVVAADVATVGGKKSAFVLIEELWLFGKRAGTEAMLQEATGGQISRREGFTIYISTQSDEPPAGVFKTKLNHARNVRDGKVIDAKFLPVLFEFPDEMIEADEYLDPANFYIPNPHIGRSVHGDWIERKLAQIEQGESEDGETYQSFVAKHLNVEIGNRLRNDRWAGADFWAEAGEPGLDLKSLLARSDVVTIGIDGGGLDDLLGFAVIGRDAKTRDWLLWGRAWAHAIVLKRRKEIAETLRDFERDGDLIFCSTPKQDIEEVAALCLEIKASKKLPERNSIGVDKLGLPTLVDELVAKGFKLGSEEGGGELLGVPQGGYLNAAIMGMERKLAAGSLLHGGQPLMGWAVSNAKVEMKGNANSITKAVAGRAKIDPLIAALNAATLMALSPEPPRERKYQMLFVG